MHFTLLLLAALPLTFAVSDAAVYERSRSRARAPKNNELSKRQTYSGRATFYATGLGACGWSNSDSDYIVALNTPQYGSGYPGPNCGRSITISANGVQVVAQIADQCPSCGWGDLDLSPGLFNRFASPDAGVFQMTWWYNNGNSQPQPQPQPSTTEKPTPTSTWTPPPTSTYTPPAPTSTYTPPAPSTTQADSPDTSAAASSVDSSTSTVAPSTAAGISSNGTLTNSTSNPYVNTKATATITSASPSATNGSVPDAGNLILLNQAVIYLGNIVVEGAKNS